MTLAEMQSATKLRNVITSIARTTINEMRPAEKIGKVYSVDTTAKLAKIYMPGEDIGSLLVARFAADKIPTKWMETTYEQDGLNAQGDIVRIAGGPGSYYILDFVSGSPAIDPSARTLIVNNTVTINQYLLELDQDLEEVNEEIIELNGSIVELNNDLTVLNTSTIPNLEADIGNANLELDALNNVTIPALNARLDEAEEAVGGGADVVFSPTQPTGLTFTDRVIWYDTDDGHRGYYWDGSSWISYQLGGNAFIPGGIVTTHMAAGVINGDRITANTLHASKITAGTISTLQFTSNTIDGNVITANSLNAAKIVAGTITTDRMTANTISGDRISVNTLSGDRIIANTIQGDRIIANTINGDRIVANTILGDRIVANTIGAGHLTATAIDGKVITGATFRTASSLKRVEINSDSGDPSRIIFYTGNAAEAAPGHILINSSGEVQIRSAQLNSYNPQNSYIYIGGPQGAISLKHLNMIELQSGSTNRLSLEATGTVTTAYFTSSLGMQIIAGTDLSVAANNIRLYGQNGGNVLVETGSLYVNTYGWIRSDSAFTQIANSNINRGAFNYGDGLYSAENSLSIGCPMYASQFYGWSDIKHKSNLAPVESALETINSLAVSDYDTPHGGATTDKNKSNELKRQRGVIAQDVQAKAPHLVKQGEADFGLAVDIYGLLATAIAGLQEVDLKVTALEGKVNGRPDKFA